MKSFQEWRNEKLKREMFSPNEPAPPAGQFFSNMNFRPGAVRKMMIRKKARKAQIDPQQQPPV
jgi:hypothetical protein